MGKVSSSKGVSRVCIDSIRIYNRIVTAFWSDAEKVASSADGFATRTFVGECL